jgi:hypothetical protein
VVLIGGANATVQPASAQAATTTPNPATPFNAYEALSSGEQSLETYRHNPEALLARLR